MASTSHVSYVPPIYISGCMVSMALMLRPRFFHCCTNWLQRLNRMPCSPSTHSTVVKRSQASLLQAPIALAMKAHSSLFFYRSQSVGINPTSDTVEPLVDNGHGGDDCFVNCSEIVLSSAIEYHNIKSWISDMRVSPLQGKLESLVEFLKLRRM